MLEVSKRLVGKKEYIVSLETSDTKLVVVIAIKKAGVKGGLDYLKFFDIMEIICLKLVVPCF